MKNPVKPFKHNFFLKQAEKLHFHEIIAFSDILHYNDAKGQKV